MVEVASSPDRGRFTFHHSWFDKEVLPEWEELTLPLRAKKVHILEVGSFEGASTTWLLDNLLTHPESTMTAVDTFEGGMEHQDSELYDINSLESRFRSNVNKCKHVDRLRVIKATSDDALLDLRREKARFDFIYIDASHVALDVLHDAVVCWRMLNVGGTMVFDDVAWKGYMEDCYNPRIAIKSFLQCAEQELEATETEGQMWVLRLRPESPINSFWPSIVSVDMAQRVSLDDPDRVILAVESDGGVILTGFSDVADVKKVNADATPFLEKIIEEADHCYKRQSRNQDRGTARCTRLFGRSKTAREVWLQQPAFLQIVNHFLRTESVPYNDKGSIPITTDAILSASATLDIGPGVQAQDLHRDDFIWQQTHTAQGEGYKLGSDVGMGLLVPGVRTTRENGATLFVPASHLWGHSRRPQAQEAVAVEMDVGEAFLFLASTVHAGGANSTLKGRPMHGFFYCRSWMRPEENQHMWFTKEEVQTWSSAAQKQAGYLRDNPFLGHCNEVDPVELFRASDRRIQE
ncbi:MAG: hypothetical protein Q9223_001841 [Gallowayella weberi]